jgi:hypothetical protein
VLTPLDTWTAGEPTVEPMPLDRLVGRYLAAFGPASVRDVQAWCGLTRLREVTDGMELRRYTAEDGTELLDLPGAEPADPDAPAPVRFLAEYDNVTLSHADRSRVVGDHPLQPLHGGPGAWVGTVLLDGLVSATWAARPAGERTSLEVRTARVCAPGEREEVEVEGRGLLGFLFPGREHDVRVTGP